MLRSICYMLLLFICNRCVFHADCKYKLSKITCLQLRLKKGATRNIVITTRALSAGNATVVAKVNTPSGVDKAQSTLTVPILVRLV